MLRPLRWGLSFLVFVFAVSTANAETICWRSDLGGTFTDEELARMVGDAKAPHQLSPGGGSLSVDYPNVMSPPTTVRYTRVPCPPTRAQERAAIQLAMSIGTAITRAASTFGPFFSNSVQDNGAGTNTANPSGTGLTGGVGFVLEGYTYQFGNGWSATVAAEQRRASNIIISRYAPEAEKAYAAYFPLKAPPQPSAPSLFVGLDGNVYFFAGGDQNITGIPGGPFGTASGTDSFKISNNVLFTAGAWLTVPIMQGWSVSVTGGFAELNQTIKYTCSTFCAVPAAVASFTASQDKWVPGGYVGGRLTTPLVIPGLPVGSNIAIDYKHMFMDSYTVALGTVATRQVGVKVSPDMDLVTVRLGVPLR